MKALVLLPIAALVLFSSCDCRRFPEAVDITPGNAQGEVLDWRYGANDIRIQTCKLSRILVDRWLAKAGFTPRADFRPRLIITEVDNRTDQYIPTDLIRQIFEGVAVNDGRFSVVVGDAHDEQELDRLLYRTQRDPKYSPSHKPSLGEVRAPQLMAKIRLSKANTAGRYHDFEDYRMSITLYDIETQEVVDSAWDVLKKRVYRR